MSKSLSIFFVLLFLFIFITEAGADTLYLNNGNILEGLIVYEDEQNIELNVGFGTVKFSKTDIKEIYRSTPEESELIYRQWQQEKILQEKQMRQQQKRIEAEKRRRQYEPKTIKFTKQSDHIVVDSVLNKKVDASLVLDTGASLVFLSHQTGKKLGLKDSLPEEKTIKVKLADGHEVDARHIFLNSLSIEGIEAKQVEAAVLPPEAKLESYDGFLGMSFLNKFNFQIDTKHKKIILQKRR